ncbi:hypothetical protein [Streptomyces botrytidirepellens]|uniref:hypothetical protein n=1 Tax=Streptomyces botrytidirepellens TaxID=2486417 RepID=UPI001C83FE8B|nr:hypothetical protein [Streptomyces botrytidirepellens]
MSAWTDLAGQTAGALLGTLVGGAITVLVARWQTSKTIAAQSELATVQQAAEARLSRAERDHERSSEAARQLLERLADLYAWLPSLPDVAADRPRLSGHAREQCASAMESLRRGMQTELFSIAAPEVRRRYRTLVKLAYDVGWRGVGRDHRERQIRDVRNYLRYVQLTLECVIDGGRLPDRLEPPVLDRAAPSAWLPPDVPWHWGDPADGS